MTSRKENADRIPIDQCVVGRLYDIRSRSLGPRAVYTGNGEFLGLRHEMVTVCMFAEYHWDLGPPYGTVFQISDTGINLPGEIPLAENTIDEDTGRWIHFDYMGRQWYFADTRERADVAKPVGKRNDALYDWLWNNGCNAKHWDKPD